MNHATEHRSFSTPDETRDFPHGRAEILVYVENAGDFTVALGAVEAVHAQKVIVNCQKLDPKLRRAIGHAHDAEDPRI